MMLFHRHPSPWVTHCTLAPAPTPTRSVSEAPGYLRSPFGHVCRACHPRLNHARFRFDYSPVPLAPQAITDRRLGLDLPPANPSGAGTHDPGYREIPHCEGLVTAVPVQRNLSTSQRHLRHCIIRNEPSRTDRAPTIENPASSASLRHFKRTQANAPRADHQESCVICVIASFQTHPSEHTARRPPRILRHCVPRFEPRRMTKDQ